MPFGLAKLTPLVLLFQNHRLNLLLFPSRGYSSFGIKTLKRRGHLDLSSGLKKRFRLINFPCFSLISQSSERPFLSF
jgi:hypothetical protein